MNILNELRNRFRVALTHLSTDEVRADEDEIVGMVRAAQETKFGDYQANCAMPLGKQLGRKPREIAEEIIQHLDIDDLCLAPEIAGPGFINLRLRDDYLEACLQEAIRDPRLGVAKTENPRTYVVDFSAPNVAKPMHVGHIRSTVIGNSLCRTLTFLGHRVISDNHIGDWGTQFGMIIYGWKHFRDEAAYAKAPVVELSRLYRLVSSLVEYYANVPRLPELQQRVAQSQDELSAVEATADLKDKKARKQVGKARGQVRSQLDHIAEIESKIRQTASEPATKAIIESGKQESIGQDVLRETAKLHAGDAENNKLWQQFIPPCLSEIEKVYQRLGVTFDNTFGESFYHKFLPGVVQDLIDRSLASESNGAICVFLPGIDAPMIIRKKDGAYLYATTDLATIKYRMESWQPDAIIYVVDHRQSLHFEQLFGVARKWGYQDVELQHVSFGTVLGQDGRPFKTRSGETVGLTGLLDEAVRRAEAVVLGTQSAQDKEIDHQEQTEIAEKVGIGSLIYADLSQNRTSDYTFSYDKMLAMNGNTAAYMQYAYARVRSIFTRGNIDLAVETAKDEPLRLAHPAERALAIELLRFSEALDTAVADYRPNHLTNYLFELSGKYSTFFEQCHVLKSDEASRHTRLMLCDLTARSIKLGLELLGIKTVERM